METLGTLLAWLVFLAALFTGEWLLMRWFLRTGEESQKRVVAEAARLNEEAQKRVWEWDERRDGDGWKE